MNINLNLKLNDNYTNKLSKIKKYNKQILLDLFIKLNTFYFNIDNDIIQKNINLFFSLHNNYINDQKKLTTIISFQHILITTYTSIFGILTQKDNRIIINEFKKNNKISNEINTQLTNLLFNTMIILKNGVFFNNTFYFFQNNYYYLICLMIVLNIFNIECDILCDEKYNMQIIKTNKEQINCILLKNINNNYINYFNDIYTNINILNDYLKNEINIKHKKLTIKIHNKIYSSNTYNTAFGYIDKIDDNIYDIYIDDLCYKINPLYKNNISIISYCFFEIINNNYKLEINDKKLNIELDKKNIISLNEFQKYNIISLKNLNIICTKY